MLSDQAELDILSREHQVPAEDVLLIALNSCGLKSDLPHPRLRFKLRLHSRPEETLFLILSLGRDNSPFSLVDNTILFENAPIATVVEAENDDVVLGYLRCNKQVLTLNSNARSTCTGCVFCPNTLENANDPRLSVMDDIENYLSMLCAEEGWQDLSHLTSVAVCTGCFIHEDKAIDHLERVREVLTRFGSKAEIRFLTSVLHSNEGFDRIAEVVAPFHLTFTIECFTNRAAILKDSKAKVGLDEVSEILARSKARGFRTDFTYVAGLDSLEDAIFGLDRLGPNVSSFPLVQVFQPHNRFMESYRKEEARSLNYYLKLRKHLEGLFASADFKPQSWENYRPLWYFAYAGQPMTCVRV